jgi:hypothetical protein
MTMTVTTVVSRARRRKSISMSSWNPSLSLMLMSPPCSIGHDDTVFQVKDSERQTIFQGLPLAYPLGPTRDDLLELLNVVKFEGYLT